MKTPNRMIMSYGKLLLGFLGMVSISVLTVCAMLGLISLGKYTDGQVLFICLVFMFFTVLGLMSVGYGVGWYERGFKDGTTGKDW